MKVSPADLIDRMSIVRLKIECIKDQSLNAELIACEDALNEYLMEGIQIKKEWLEDLYKINKEEWDLLEEMNKERIAGNNYEKIGKLYLQTELVNKRRSQVKNMIVENTKVGFKEIKKNHPSA
jgi:hypothetical protein